MCVCFKIIHSPISVWFKYSPYFGRSVLHRGEKINANSYTYENVDPTHKVKEVLYTDIKQQQKSMQADKQKGMQW